VRRYLATETFWKKFYGLPDEQKAQTGEAWEIFKIDPFDPRLGTHRINVLSARANRTVYAAVIAQDLRLTFYIEGNSVITVDIGSHAAEQSRR
jgi:hypothetical protein